MVGLVVVAHSPALARAAVELALEMVHGPAPRVATAAGVEGGAFGTDAVAVQTAIEQVDNGDGVVVLMDLGSAVLSSEMALELLDPELRERVFLTSAPLVEGLVAAVVEAAAGEPPEAVILEAIAGLHGKEAQLGTPAIHPEPPVEDEGGEREMFAVTISHGLHARPAARLVSAVKRFEAAVRVRNATTDSAYAPASSLSRVAAIGARQDHQLEVVASGPQRHQALEAVLALVARDFDEPPTAAAPVVALEATAEGPLPASPGIGIGPKWSIGGGEVEIPETAGDANPEQEWQSLQAGIAAARQEISQTRARLLRNGDEQSAAIFDAHLMLLDDSEILEEVRNRIDDGTTAAAAWKTELQRVEAEWAHLDNPYLNARAADVRAVGNQVLRHLLGRERHITSQSGILVATDVNPNDIARLDPDLVAGIVTAAGAPTSHAAILARALNIPAVVAAGSEVLNLADGTELIIDGSDGTVLVAPTAATMHDYQARADELAAAETAARSRAQQPAVTSDGVVIEVAVNIGAVSAPLVVGCGADAVGVLRTEFLFLGRTEPPSVADQETEYRRLAAGLGGRRLTIRTLDVGGDKSIDYLSLPPETNPFLGIRGIRVSLRHPDLLHAQLTAAIRVAHDHPVSLLFPMVTVVAELDQALEMLDTVCSEQGGRPRDLEVGIMVEVPAVAVNATAFVPRVDFLSIGTNDLTQYALAAERGNQSVAYLSDTLDPGVLRLIQSVVVAAADDDTKVAVCGVIAADLTAVPVLVGLGVDELSVTPFAVPRVKDEVRRWSYTDAAALVAEVITLDSAAAVRAAVAKRR